MKHLPNVITVTRMLCAPLLALEILDGDYWTAFYLAVFMGLSDAVDGYLAKRFAWESALGEALDPLADKLMLTTAFVTFAVAGLAPVWLAALVAARDLLLVCGAAAQHFYGGGCEFRASLASKINTCLQIILVFHILGAQLELWSDAWTMALIVATAATTLASGLGYAAELVRRRARAVA